MALDAMNSPTNNSWLKTLEGKHPKQPHSEEEYLALCLIMLARSGTAKKETAAKDSFSPQETHSLNNSYKCTICNKSFPSHQALGGHKASHSKPYSAEKPSASVVTSAGGAVGRTHECSICHKSFPSGQALGGHKRRHYEGHIGGNNSNNSGESQSLSQSQSRGLGFDLNVLPEVESDDELESHVPRKRQRLLEEDDNDDHQV